MTARRVRSAAVVRAIGTAAVSADGSERELPGAARGEALGGVLGSPRTGDRYVALDQLREQIARVEWAPLRLAGGAVAGARARPASPRLPHALLLHVAHAARLASAGEPHALVPLADVPVVLDVGALAGFVGTDDEGVTTVLRALLQAGALRACGPARVDALPKAVALAPALLGPAPRCAALDWDAVALATAGAPSAWVAAHVLAERLAVDEWTPMPRSALEHTLGCGVSGVRSALDRLTMAGVVERREQRGGVSAYRFGPGLRAAVGPGQGREGPRPALRAAPPLAPRATSAPSAPPIVTPTPAATGVRLTVGGVELDVPAGLRVRVEIGADGTPQITLVPAASGPG